MEITPGRGGYGYLLKWFIGLGDLLIINVFFLVAYKYFKEFILDGQTLSSHEIVEICLLINLSYFITINITKVDTSSNIIFFDKIIQMSFKFIAVYTIVLTIGLSILINLNLSWSSYFILFLILCFVYSMWNTILRILLKTYRRRGHNFKRVVIVGGGLNGINVHEELSSCDYGFKILGFFDDNTERKDLLPNYLGGISLAEQFCVENDVDEIYCTLPGNQETKILQLINFSEKNMIRFYLVPEFYKYIKRKLILSFLRSTPVVALRNEPLEYTYNRIIKRTFDLVFSGIVLVTIFPSCYIILGAIIKLTSRGPILFKQKRTGLQGKLFDCYKFRSMQVNNNSDIIATVKSDPRITPIGAFMRRTSLDEIPQFINVFKGNMTVVGPRPHMIQQTELYSKLIDKFMIRHFVKPGITGWAQVSGCRGETKTINQMENRFKHDVWYLENWSFILDMKIIVVTIINLFKGEDNAY